MKKTLFFILLACVALVSKAQQTYQSFTSDTTVNGDTLINTTGDVVKYLGFVTWDFSVRGKTATDSIYVELQGSNDYGVTWDHLDTTTVVSATKQNYHLIDNPAEYLRYRLYFRADSVADTLYVPRSLFIYKR